MTSPAVQSAPFPASSRTTSGVVNNALTTVTSLSFSDKILITITSPASGSKLAHWIHVPLASSASLMDPTFNSTLVSSDTDTSLLPRSDLTATTVLGGTKREDEVIGQTLATTIASAILMKRPSEERMLVLGFGLQGLSDTGMGSQMFEELVGLVLGVL